MVAARVVSVLLVRPGQRVQATRVAAVVVVQQPMVTAQMAAAVS
jgi:hypothetical protein